MKLICSKTLVVTLFCCLNICSGVAIANPSSCASLGNENFSSIADAPAHIISTVMRKKDGVIPQHCRVQGYIATNIGFEIHIPENIWNKKILMQGCGGFCGSTDAINKCHDALARGYACVASDLGHKSTPIDAKWAYNNPQGEIDFYFRATHSTISAAKVIIKTYKGNAAEKSYFRGCSTGGRQGLISAQRFPNDFDGIISGASAGVGVAEGIHLIWSALSNLDSSGKQILLPHKIPLLHDAVINSCDMLDGLEDGLIADPRKCKFDPADLQCRRRPADDCLTGPEVSVIRKIYSGASTPEGKNIYRATPMLGSELNWVPAYINEVGRKPVYYDFGAEYFRYLAFAEDPGPSWLPESFDFERDPPRVGYNRHFNNAGNPNLRGFSSVGAKLIMYHGWSDQSVPPLTSINYLSDVENFMQGSKGVSNFLRLFMLPGVGHCGSGSEGPNQIDLLTALENWVEYDVAPDQVIAYLLKNSDLSDPFIQFPVNNNHVQMSRPVYPYPIVTKYVSGSMTKWSSFEPSSAK
jgi:hypothetical protein